MKQCAYDKSRECTECCAAFYIAEVGLYRMPQEPNIIQACCSRLQEAVYPEREKDD